MSRLPEPQMPPRDQQELLAASLYPIVSFVVLGSILIRMPLVILFFFFGFYVLIPCFLRWPFHTVAFLRKMDCLNNL